MARIRLVLDASVGPPYDSVEHRRFLAVLRSGPESAADREFVARPHLGLEPIEIGARSGAGEIVAVDAHGHVSVGVPKHTRRRGALNEPHLDEGRGILVLPAFRCPPSAVHVSLQKPTHARRCAELGRELDVHWIRWIGVGVEVRPADVDEDDLLPVR